MIRHSKRLAAVASVTALLFAGCRDTSEDDDSGPAATEAPSATEGGAATTSPETDAPGTTAAATETTAGGATETTTGESAATTAPEEPAGEAWTINVDDCPSDAVTAPIEGELKIGTVQPLTGPVAGGYKPVNEGLQLFIDYANENNLLPDVTLSLQIGDDQYDSTQTLGVVESQIDSGVNIFSGILGSPNNLAVRDLLNEECIPQLLALTGEPAWGEAEEYPWTTGVLVPYSIEVQIYAKKIKELLGEGATVGIYGVNNDFGNVFLELFKAAAEEQGLEVVEEQTIEPADLNPPVNQVNAIAGAAPQAILAAPLSLQCPAFLKEVINAKATNADWDPLIFLTNTCSSRLLIQVLAQGAGDGVYTSGNTIDPADPKFADVPGNVTFKAAYDAAGLEGDLGTTAVGWHVGEATLNILLAAQESGTLSRQSIIEAARNLEFVPSLGREGTVYKMNGLEDTNSFESLTVLQWNEASGTYTEIGEEDTSYESS